MAQGDRARKRARFIRTRVIHHTAVAGGIGGMHCIGIGSTGVCRAWRRPPRGASVEAVACTARSYSHATARTPSVSRLPLGLGFPAADRHAVPGALRTPSVSPRQVGRLSQTEGVKEKTGRPPRVERADRADREQREQTESARQRDRKMRGVHIGRTFDRAADWLILGCFTVVAFNTLIQFSPQPSQKRTLTHGAGNQQRPLALRGAPLRRQHALPSDRR